VLLDRTVAHFLIDQQGFEGGHRGNVIMDRANSA